MKNRKYKSLLSLIMSVILAFSLLCAGISAAGAGNNVISRSGAGTAGRSADGAASSDNGMMGNDTYEGNIDSGTDGHIDEDPGTGEFADDTSDQGNTSSNSDNSSEGPVESMIDGVVTGAADAVDDAANAVDDASDGNMWGIIIAIIIIAAVALLLFAFLKRKK